MPSKGISSKSCPLFVYEDTTPTMTSKWLLVTGPMQNASLIIFE